MTRPMEWATACAVIVVTCTFFVVFGLLALRSSTSTTQEMRRLSAVDDQLSAMDDRLAAQDLSVINTLHQLVELTSQEREVMLDLSNLRRQRLDMLEARIIALERKERY